MARIFLAETPTILLLKPEVQDFYLTLPQAMAATPQQAHRRVVLSLSFAICNRGTGRQEGVWKAHGFREGP